MLPSSRKEQHFPFCLPLIGTKWLFREAGGSWPVQASRWVSSISLTLPAQHMLPSHARSSQEIPGGTAPSIPGLDSRSQPLSCVWSEEVGPLIGKTVPERLSHLESKCEAGCEPLSAREEDNAAPHPLACGNLMTASVTAVWMCPDERTCLLITPCGDLPPYPFH